MCGYRCKSSTFCTRHGLIKSFPDAKLLMSSSNNKIIAEVCWSSVFYVGKQMWQLYFERIVTSCKGLTWQIMPIPNVGGILISISGKIRWLVWNKSEVSIFVYVKNKSIGWYFCLSNIILWIIIKKGCCILYYFLIIANSCGSWGNL